MKKIMMLLLVGLMFPAFSYSAEYLGKNIDGIEYDVKISSNKVKLISPFDIQDNETRILTLDFDIHKSIHKTGNDKYIMNPTIKVIHE